MVSVGCILLQGCFNVDHPIAFHRLVHSTIRIIRKLTIATDTPLSIDAVGFIDILSQIPPSR